MIHKKTRIALLSTALLLTLAACAEPDAGMDLQQRRQAAEAVDPRIVQAQNEFGMKLHRQLTEAEKAKGNQAANVVLSPYSVSTALAIAYNGAGGNTAGEMAETLGWTSIGKDEANAGNRALQSLLERSGDSTELRVANSLWYRKGLALHKPFLDTVKADYRAELHSTDLSGKETPDAINRWVSKQTKGKIDKMVNGPLGQNIVAVILNAIYFNGTWTDPFPKSSTQEEPFTLADGTEAKVPMMRQTGSYAYAENEAWQAIRLPYGDGRMAMLVVLPKERSSLDELHERLWTDSSEWRKPFEHATVDIRLPRFKTEGAWRLNEPLAGLGMRDAFDPSRADFSALADIRPLYINEVAHKVYIDVNEEGTEAAAATSVGIATSGPPERPLEMTVNRPFFFAIEDTQTKAWLFVGSIGNPAES
ncbi:serpin family protein [Paenibacillus flagellatus]|nr:serpin family protein [Paenibacillus flagellatus]